MNITNSIAVGLAEERDFRSYEPITSLQKRKLQDLIFQRFDNSATINQCLSYVEGLNRNEVDEYVNSILYLKQDLSHKSWNQLY